MAPLSLHSKKEKLLAEMVFELFLLERCANMFLFSGNRSAEAEIEKENLLLRLLLQLLVGLERLKSRNVFFCSTSLPLARTRWVRLTFSSLCPLF